jgi:hypothetical protein
MLEQAIKALSKTGRVLVLCDGKTLPIREGSLQEVLEENNIFVRDIRKVVQKSDNLTILSVNDVINHDIGVPLMRIREDKCAWSSPKHIRTIRGALAVV